MWKKEITKMGNDFEREPGVEYFTKKEVFQGEEIEAVYRVARKPEQLRRR